MFKLETLITHTRSKTHTQGTGCIAANRQQTGQLGRELGSGELQRETWWREAAL